MYYSIGGYYGGKATMVKTLIPLMTDPAYYPPGIDMLVSPFAGFASVELNLDITHKELFDINPATVSLLTMIRDDCEKLVSVLTIMAWNRGIYDQALHFMQSKDSHKRAVAAMAFASTAHHRGGSVSGFSQQQCDRAAKRDWSYLYPVSEQLRDVDIYCMDFRQSMLCNCDALLYLDPPYLQGGKHYQHTMSIDDHRDMLTLAIDHPGPVAISGYASQLYQEYLSDWRQFRFKARSSNRKSKTEVLWLNY